jgi:hypothetical protein
VKCIDFNRYSAGMDTDTRTLPPGDLHWDGDQLTIGGEVLAPGRYRLANGGVLDLVAADEDDELPAPD